MTSTARFAVLAFTAVVGVFAAAGCSKDSTASASASSGAPIPAEAQETYAQRCAMCHGTSGKGDGSAAAALNPKPRNYTDAAWQKSVKDEDLRTVILKGGAGAGKSPLMPASPDLESKPAVVNGLISIIRSYNGK